MKGLFCEDGARANTVECELRAGGRHSGELMGIPPTGREIDFAIRTLGRFEGERLARRWDRTDFEGLLRQLHGHT